MNLIRLRLRGITAVSKPWYCHLHLQTVFCNPFLKTNRGARITHCLQHSSDEYCKRACRYWCAAPVSMQLCCTSTQPGLRTCSVRRLSREVASLAHIGADTGVRRHTFAIPCTYTNPDGEGYRGPCRVSKTTNAERKHQCQHHRAQNPHNLHTRKGRGLLPVQSSRMGGATDLVGIGLFCA